jgi:hypothetical protein
MKEDRKIDHAMMSFALIGNLLVTPRPRPERHPSQISLIPKRSWFLRD